MIHDTSNSRGPTRRHLPVQHGDGPEVLVEHVADAGVAPRQHRWRRGDVGREVVLQPRQCTLDQRRAADVGHRELVPVLQPAEVPAQRGVAGRIDLGEEAERLLGVGDRVQLGQHLDGRILQLAPFLGGRVGEPVAAERVGHDVGRHDARDVVHQEERRAEHGPLVVDPPDAGDRHVGEFADLPDHLELVVESVCREDRDILGRWRHPGHPLLLDRSAVLLPPAGEDDGLRRHPVGFDAALDGHLWRCSAWHDGGQPLRHHRREAGDVTG